MNTPKTLKRYNLSGALRAARESQLPPGHFVHSLQNDEYAGRLARIVSEFEVMESYMPRLLAALMGTQDTISASYIYSKLRSPNARLNMMKYLLEENPVNRELGQEFDKIITDYNVARKGRNNFVHGRWYTSTENNSVYFARQSSDDINFLRARKLSITKLDELITLISSILNRLILLRLGPPPHFTESAHLHERSGGPE